MLQQQPQHFAGRVRLLTAPAPPHTSQPSSVHADALSISLSIFNKEMVGKKFQDFPAPLLMVSTQFLFQMALGALAAKLRPDLNLTPRALTWDVWAQTTGWLGLLTGLDIGVSNVALRTVSLSSYTVIKVPVRARTHG